jgi:hypothetical protein
MKHYLLGFFLFASFLAAAQPTSSFVIRDAANNNPVTSEQYVYLDQAATADTEFDLHIQNVSSSSKNVKVRRLELSTIASTKNYFCWVQCYDSTTSVSPTGLNIAAGATNFNNFHAYYRANNQPGESVILYRFFDSNNPSDSVSVRVHFVATPASVAKVSEAPSFSFHPNPSREFVQVTLTSGAREVMLRNLLGQIVAQPSLEAGQRQLTLSVEALPLGVYLLSVRDRQGRLSSQKLVVE